MELQVISDEASKIWKRVASDTVGNQLELELELYKKLLNFFQVGDYYYFIFNLKKLDFDHVSDNILDVAGYSPSELTVAKYLEYVHEDDQPWLVSFENKTADFLAKLPADKVMKYKNRYDYRFRKKDGSYIRVLHQAVIAQMDESGGFVRTLGIITDISHLKMEGKPMMSLIGMEGEPSYLNVDVNNIFIAGKEVLTTREKQILALLSQGKLSKEIGDILNISKQTVDTHRKNMLSKTKAGNTAGLIHKAIKEGLI
jgi:DNA-binding CsgD family transcriptional regulator